MPAAPHSRPGSYPVKPVACHPFLKEGEVCNAAPTYPVALSRRSRVERLLAYKFSAEGAGAPLPARLDSIDSVDSFDSLDILEQIDGIEIIERIDGRPTFPPRFSLHFHRKRRETRKNPARGTRPTAPPELWQPCRPRPTPLPELRQPCRPRPTPLTELRQHRRPRPTALPELRQPCRPRPTALTELWQPCRPRPTPLPELRQPCRPRPTALTELWQPCRPRPTPLTELRQPCRPRPTALPELRQHRFQVKIPLTQTRRPIWSAAACRRFQSGSQLPHSTARPRAAIIGCNRIPLWHPRQKVARRVLAPQCAWLRDTARGRAALPIYPNVLSRQRRAARESLTSPQLPPMPETPGTVPASPILISGRRSRCGPPKVSRNRGHPLETPAGPRTGRLLPRTDTS